MVPFHVPRSWAVPHDTAADDGAEIERASANDEARSTIFFIMIFP
jgi:hypothetical protein